MNSIVDTKSVHPIQPTKPIYRRIRPGDGWSGYALGQIGGEILEGIMAFLARPDQLADGADSILKTDADNMVVVRPLPGGTDISCVAKYQRYNRRKLDRLRGLWPLHARDSFVMGIRLLNLGIPTPRPLVALERRRWMEFPESLLITEYVKDCHTLYGFLRDDLHRKDPAFARTKRELSRQIATIFSRLHRDGLRHRDAKPSNLLVRRSDGSIEVMLVDLEGIRRRWRIGPTEGFQALAQLASKVLWCASLYRTDFYRVFSEYCQRVLLDSDRRSRVYLSLSERAIGERVMTLAEAMMKTPGLNQRTGNSRGQ